MHEPTWHRPSTVDEALAVLAGERERASVVAGGTDLVPRIRCGLESPAVLVDLLRIEEMRYVRRERGDGKRPRTAMGALATHGSIAGLLAPGKTAGPEDRPAGDRAGLALLSQACRSVGGPQIRARGTIGGNVANASPAADAATALLALDASVEVASKAGGRRDVPLESILRCPGETSLGADELIAGFSFREPGDDASACYLKEGQRKALAIAVCSVALIMDREEGRLRIALGSVAPTPVRVREAEELWESEWRGGGNREALVREVARVAAAAASPIDDIRASAEYRATLVRVLVRRCLEETWR
jgi:CO/xanthine dehydrogenase FAD-binding subunit